MITITPTAATALTNARAEKGAPETYGVRFFATDADTSEKARLAFNFVASPKPDDKVVDEAGLTAYVDPEVDRVMGDIIVDVEMKGQHEGLVVKRPSRRD